MCSKKMFIDVLAPLAAAAALFAASAASASVIAVAPGAVAASDTTQCSLVDAVAAANASVGSNVAVGACTPTGNPGGGGLGYVSGNVILLPTRSSYTLTVADNDWYGPNALPPIASTIVIVGNGAQLIAAHRGDPAPATADAFRFFYVSGGLNGELSAGDLTLFNLSLRGGVAKGGDTAFIAGGGAGMGGAVFNQGALSMIAVTLDGNLAQGGSALGGNLAQCAGGGMGADADTNGGGGGFGPAWQHGFGGAGGSSSYGSGGGGGGGFVTASNGLQSPNAAGGRGGGRGGLGGSGAASVRGAGGAAGDGGGGGGGSRYRDFVGGGFGFGGSDIDGSAGSGGGVGGGGGGNTQIPDGASGGGGFGGGAGAATDAGHPASGGFGGGSSGSATPAFGGGKGVFNNGAGGGSGAGMGGAIFNHGGNVHLINVSAARNGAQAGKCFDTGACGSGLGAVIFNLNGHVTIEFSTLADNTLAFSNGILDAYGAEDATVYSLAFGNSIGDGSASTAALTVSNSIIARTRGDAAAMGDDVVVNVRDAAQANISTVNFAGSNIVPHTYTVLNALQTGRSPNTVDAQTGAFITDHSPVQILPIGSDSPAYNAAVSCQLLDGTALTSDERGVTRPLFGACDIGAYEFDGGYIFADGFD